MAEAGIETNTSSSRFYCHKCSDEITPTLPDYVCPRCNSGFIEILEAAQDSDTDSSNDMDYEVLELMEETLSQHPSRQNSTQSNQSNSSSSSSDSHRRRRPNTTLHRPGRRRSAVNPPTLAPLLQDLMMHITSGVLGASVGTPEFIFPRTMELPGFSMMLTSSLASNPADYVWGRGGLDAIITQLMNQLDGTGPPPLPQEKIAQIPTVHITKEQCEKNLQCSVCMEDFQLDESVRKLYCDHCYHDNCIIPWLEMHGTCPICRKTVADHPNNPSTEASESMDTAQPANFTSSDDASSLIAELFSSNIDGHAQNLFSSSRSSRSSHQPNSMHEDELD